MPLRHQPIALLAAGLACCLLLEDDAFTFDQLRFSDVPATATAPEHPAPINTPPHSVSAQFHSVIAESARNGPNFARAYRLVEWGCGAGCLQLAIVNLHTGDVTISPDLLTLATGHPDAEHPAACPQGPALHFRTNSALLVVIGAPNEQAQQDGIHWYKWDGRGLLHLRTCPYSPHTCPQQQSAIPD